MQLLSARVRRATHRATAMAIPIGLLRFIGYYQRALDNMLLNNVLQHITRVSTAPQER